jgi:SRSO17 transposase
MAAVVESGCEQQFQHFISNSPWDHGPVVAQIARDADQLLGGKSTSSLIIDECSFPKQGDCSVGPRLRRGRLWLGNGLGGWARWTIAKSRCSAS